MLSSRKIQEKILKLSKYKGLPAAEYEALYWKLRRKNDQSILGSLSLRTRQRLHPVFLAIYKLLNRLHGIRVIVSGEKLPENGPLIFAPTHVGKYDVEAIGEAVQKHFYLLSGDFENLQGGPEQAFLNLNGVFYFRETDAEDRKAVAKKMIQHLCDGGNMLYFPEGAWNFSPNLPVQPLFPGIIRVAKEANAYIVPIGVEQYGKRFVIRIGCPMNSKDYPDIDSSLETLRDQMATLKWSIWNEEQCAKREELHPDLWEHYIDDRLAEWPGFSREHIAGLVYRPKGITDPLEAFTFMNNLIPNRENAFLFDKRLVGVPIPTGINLPST